MSLPIPSTLDVIHALLDMTVSYDDDATEDLNSLAAATAIERLNAIGAFTVRVDGDTGEFHADTAPLLTAVAVLVEALVRHLAMQLDTDRLGVLATMREHLDSVLME